MDTNIQYTKKQRISNFFYYNMWWIIALTIVIGVICSLIYHKLELGVVQPDYQFAYVGSTFLPDDTIVALETSLATLGEDINGDGQVKIKLRQYVTGNTQVDAEGAAGFLEAATVNLIGDITHMESTYFLLESPIHFQYQHQILANPDGSLPDSNDFTIDDKVYMWKDCPTLSSLELGTYTDTYLGETITGNNQDLLTNLYLGRRGYYKETPKHLNDYIYLWYKMISD